MSELSDDILSLMSDIVMAADTHGVVDENDLEYLSHLIDTYFQEKTYGTDYPH